MILCEHGDVEYNDISQDWLCFVHSQQSHGVPDPLESHCTC